MAIAGGTLDTESARNDLSSSREANRARLRRHREQVQALKEQDMDAITGSCRGFLHIHHQINLIRMQSLFVKSAVAAACSERNDLEIGRS